MAISGALPESCEPFPDVCSSDIWNPPHTETKFISTWLYVFQSSAKHQSTTAAMVQD